jgi:hypothetical protein
VKIKDDGEEKEKITEAEISNDVTIFFLELVNFEVNQSLNGLIIQENLAKKMKMEDNIVSMECKVIILFMVLL